MQITQREKKGEERTSRVKIILSERVASEEPFLSFKLLSNSRSEIVGAFVIEVRY